MWPSKIVEVRYERGKRTGQTHLSLIPCLCASAPLPSLQLQREGTLHFFTPQKYTESTSELNLVW